MRCCGVELNTLELQVAGEPFVLYRCGVCDTTHWTRDNKVVPFEGVAQMLRRDTEERAARKVRRPRTGPEGVRGRG